MPAFLADHLIDHRNGIFTLDAGYIRPHFAAIHLLQSEGRIAIVDTATYHALPRVLAALAALGLSAEAVDYVILTHIHLDHAGGAGAMMQSFPQAKLVVHPRGSRHMCDPSRLMAGTRAVYGRERADAMYGELLPIAAERIIEARDNSRLMLGARELLFVDAPGHAFHHMAIIDIQTNSIFSGDALGIAFPPSEAVDMRLLMPSSTPVQFDPHATQQTISRLLAFDPAALYLTHFGRLTPPPGLLQQLHGHVDRYIAIAHAAATAHAPEPTNAIRAGLADYLLATARAYGYRQSDAELLDDWRHDLDLNAQGLAVWLKSNEK